MKFIGLTLNEFNKKGLRYQLICYSHNILFSYQSKFYFYSILKTFSCSSLVFLIVSKLRWLSPSLCYILDLVTSSISISWFMLCDLLSNRGVRCGSQFLTGRDTLYSMLVNSYFFLSRNYGVIDGNIIHVKYNNRNIET